MALSFTMIRSFTASSTNLTQHGVECGFSQSDLSCGRSVPTATYVPSCTVRIILGQSHPRARLATGIAPCLTPSSVLPRVPGFQDDARRSMARRTLLAAGPCRYPSSRNALCRAVLAIPGFPKNVIHCSLRDLTTTCQYTSPQFCHTSNCL